MNSSNLSFSWAALTPISWIVGGNSGNRLAFNEGDGFRRAGGDAKPAPDAFSHVERCDALFHFNGLHRAALLCTDAASSTILIFYARLKTARLECVRMPQLRFAAQDRAAERAAVADQVCAVRAVVAGIDQSRLFRAVQHMHPFLPGDVTGESAFDEELGRSIEDEAHVLRLVALAHARSSRTVGKGDVARAVDQMLNLFVGMDAILRFQ